MPKLKSVLIGCGAIAREHLATLAELKNVEVVAVCDLSDARAEATTERFGIAKSYSNYDEMLYDVKPDLVHITTPPATHFSIAKNCLARGLNVLCEKPITVNYEDFLSLKELAIKNNCMLMENQNLRCHSSIKRLSQLVQSGAVGDILDVEISFSLNLLGTGSPYTDQNAPHFGLSLRGGVIGDFLPHIAYLAYMFTGPVNQVRTIWMKHTIASPLPYDEFRGFIKGEQATAHVAFSGNSQVSGYWVRVTGTKMLVETNLLEPPRFTQKRFRGGEPALMTLIDGIVEARDVLAGTVAGFWRKLGGVSSYDGLPALITQIYQSLEKHEPQPVPLDEIDQVAHLVDQLTSSEFML